VVGQLCRPGSHINIVSVFRCGRLPPSYYYLDMELCDLNLEWYIECESRKVVNDESQNSLGEFTSPRMQFWHVMEDIAKGIAYIHSNGKVHRDIKPRNGMILLFDLAK